MDRGGGAVGSSIKSYIRSFGSIRGNGTVAHKSLLWRSVSFDRALLWFTENGDQISASSLNQDRQCRAIVTHLRRRGSQNSRSISEFFLDQRAAHFKDESGRLSRANRCNTRCVRGSGRVGTTAPLRFSRSQLTGL